MSIGAAIYGYRNNFSCKEGSTKIPKKRKISLKLVDLMREYYRYMSPYDDDLFVSICQWLQKKGYPVIASATDILEDVDKFMHEALFSCSPFLAENFYINKGKFKLFEWRKQFNLFEDTEIKGLNFYRNRKSIPLPNFASFDEIKKIIFTNFTKYNAINDTLQFQFNSCHAEANVIFSKSILIHKDHFTYTIGYGYREDAPPVKGGSSWQIFINSEKDENYIDFCLRIYNNYDKILCGDPAVLINKDYNRYSLAFPTPEIMEDFIKCLKCFYCGQLFNVKEVNIEHLIPLSKGGRDNCSNKVQTCIFCNTEKGSTQLPIYKRFCEEKKKKNIEYPPDKIRNIGYAIQYILDTGMLCFKDEKSFLKFKQILMSVKNTKFSPWKNGEEEHNKAVVYDSTGKMIADCNIFPLPTEACEANANLIKHAPAMFYQLQQVIACATENSEVITHCKELIEKILTGKYTPNQ